MLKIPPISKLFLFAMFFLLLFGCASSRVAEQLQSGKISFEDGNFKSAFHKLLPLASEGNASAEYAVGYMYYYGYGTTQDNESGLFWMRKSAEQHYQPAIKALDIIEKNKVSEEPTQQLTAQQSVNIDSNQLLRKLTENAEESSDLSNNENKPVDLAENTSESTELNDNTSLKQNDNTLLKLSENTNESSPTLANEAKQDAADFNIEHAKKYTLQLMASYDLSDVKRTQNQLHLQKSSFLAHTERNGKHWYILAYGKYPASYLAKLALDDLPQDIRAMKPWVRPLSDMKQLA